MKALRSQSALVVDGLALRTASEEAAGNTAGARCALIVYGLICGPGPSPADLAFFLPDLTRSHEGTKVFEVRTHRSLNSSSWLRAFV